MPGGGGFAEYVSVRAAELAPMPASISFEQAAAVPMAASTALIGLRDEGRVRPGQRVLVNGASGGVGTDLMTLAGLIDEGTVTPVIDRIFSFDEIPAAVAYQETGRPAGKVVVTI
jgi:NADPH:quinone reductase-like Zn-dependent oxidoreductase